MNEQKAWEVLKRSDYILEAQIGCFFCRESDKSKVTQEEFEAISYLCAEWDCCFEYVKDNS
jgi:hypothetical protein